jgi:hypothetical protein
MPPPGLLLPGINALKRIAWLAWQTARQSANQFRLNPFKSANTEKLSASQIRDRRAALSCFVMRGLDPRIHVAPTQHGLPGQARQ